MVVPDDLEADFIVVGGGSAGAVVASRLSEDPATSVILVEAGGNGRSFLTEMPAGFARIVANPEFDWLYEPVADPSQGGREWIWSAGKMLGGSSSLNGQVYIRGARADYDEWAALGATGWSFNDVFPYFLRSESWRGKPSQAHGSTGPMTVSPVRDPNPLCRVFLSGCAEAGIPTLEEHNDGSDFGAFMAQTNQRRGLRCGTEKAYLRPARRRRNLMIVTEAEVKCLRLDSRRAVGIEFIRDGIRQFAKARRETILSAGALGSPALLMRSGIGPANYLCSRGIEPLCDRSEIGQNLQEHPIGRVSKFVSVPTLNMQLGRVAMLRHTLNFLLRRKGPLSAPAIQAMALAKTSDDLDRADVQLHFSPLAYSIKADAHTIVSSPMAPRPALTIAASICKPKGRGHIVLGEDGRPRVVHQLLGNEDDVSTLIAGLRLIQRIFETPSFQAIVEGDFLPVPLPADRSGWLEYLRGTACLTWHPAGTCRMGSDEAAVVDPELRVNEIGGLRIADVSIMPTLPSCNTNAPTIMIGERAAELMRASIKRGA